MPYGCEPCAKGFLIAIVGSLLLLASCDAVTEPDMTSTAQEAFSEEVPQTTTASAGDTELFNCYVSQLTADGTYVEKLARFSLPTSLGWTDQDALVVAAYRNIFLGTTITTRIANCRIPDHPDAISYMADLLEADFIGTLGVGTFSGDDEDCGDDVAFCGDLEGIEVTASRCDNETALSCGGTGGEYIGWHWDDIFDDWDDSNPHDWEPVGGDPNEPCEDCLPPEPCDTGNDFIDSDAFAEAAQDLWERSNMESAQHLREEQGGFLSPSPIDDSFDYAPMPEHWLNDSGPCHIDFGVGESLPDNSIFIHTHPFERGEIVTVCDTEYPVRWEPAPSKLDREALEDIEVVEGLTGIVIDADTIILFTADDSKDEKFERCAY